MNRGLFAGLLLCLTLATACTPRIYGVPEPVWQGMSEQERIAAIDAYRQRQVLLQQQREERARQRKLEAERRRRREAEEARRQRRLVEARYRGEGVYGDLLLVRISGGMVNFSGKHRHYRPLAFRIAEGETRDLTVVDDRGRRTRLIASYRDRTLALDAQNQGHRRHPVRLAYAPGWSRGRTYRGIDSQGPLQLRGVAVEVSVLGSPPARRHPHVREAPPAAERPISRDRRTSSPQEPADRKGSASRRTHARRAPRPVPAPKRESPPAPSERNRPEQAPPPAAGSETIRVIVHRAGNRAGKRQLFMPNNVLVLKAGESRSIHPAYNPHWPLTFRYADGVLTITGGTAGAKNAGRTVIRKDRTWQGGRVKKVDLPGGKPGEKLELEIIAGNRG
jgi:hypothetical protein